MNSFPPKRPYTTLAFPVVFSTRLLIVFALFGTCAAALGAGYCGDKPAADRFPLADGLIAAGKLDVTGLAGQWESFVIETIQDPLPGVKRGLVIAGSDRRGTAYGVYELSQRICVSPWYWWADVTPLRRNALHISAERLRVGPPEVIGTT